MESISRRKFIAASALATGAGLVASTTALAAETPSSTGNEAAAGAASASTTVEASETMSCDLVVVGSGISGLSAALEASDQGLSVILLEKEANLSGTLAGTEGIFGLGSQEQADAGVELPSKWELIETELEYTNWRTDSLLWEDLMSASGADVDWLAEKGATFERVDNYLDQSAYSTFHWWTGETGNASGIALGQTVENQGVQVLLSTPATDLIIDSDGAVTGVHATREDGSVIEIDAQAVLLACGGLANDLDLLGEKVGLDLSTASSLFPIHEVGDGLTMAEVAGAKETPINYMNVFNVGGYTANDPISIAFTLQPINLFVNGNGERFMPEDLYVRKFFALTTNSFNSQKEAFCVMSKAMVDRMENEGCICGVAQTKAGDKLEGLSAQVEEAIAAGNAFSGDTIAELAEAIGADPDTLQATIDRYNELCAAGADEDFGKDAAYLEAFEEGPFYAVRPCLSIFATMGGIAVDRQMRVLDANDQPITGLYSSGSASCGLYKETYCYQVSGGMNAYCCYSGREAARQVAAEIAG